MCTALRKKIKKIFFPHPCGRKYRFRIYAPARFFPLRKNKKNPQKIFSAAPKPPPKIKTRIFLFSSGQFFREKNFVPPQRDIFLQIPIFRILRRSTPRKGREKENKFPIKTADGRDKKYKRDILCSVFHALLCIKR